MSWPVSSLALLALSPVLGSTAHLLDQCFAAVQSLRPCGVNASHSCLFETNCSGLRNEVSPSSCTLLVLPPALPSSERLSYAPTTAEVWTYGGISVAIISLSGVSGGLLWPLFNSPFYHHVMRLLIGLAVGSLTSTALFQLIPEGFNLPEHDPSQDYLYTAFYTWFSIWLLFALESMSKIVFRKHREVEEVHHPVQVLSMNCAQDGKTSLGPQFELDMLISQRDAKPAKEKGQVATVAWMVIFGDGLHNFIDGMSIGAGYTQGIKTGIGISIAIACEEFPHELGDFAILIQSGMSMRKALFYNFMSACTAFVGLALGIVLGKLEGAHYIFAFAGGLFLYVSHTHLIPELKSMLKEGLRQGRCQALVCFLLQNAGILIGSCLLFLITKYNDTISQVDT